MVCEIIFASTGVICGNPYPVCKKWQPFSIIILATHINHLDVDDCSRWWRGLLVMIVFLLFLQSFTFFSSSISFFLLLYYLFCPFSPFSGR